MNRTRIQLSFPFTDSTRRRRWETLGFITNPFPDSGIATTVDYNEHQIDEILRINTWLNETMVGEKEQFGPLLIKGSIGVGKTHVLKRIEHAVTEMGAQRAPGKMGASYHTITGLGAKNLTLSMLMLEALRTPPAGADNSSQGVELPLVGEIYQALRKGDGTSSLNALPRTSPLRAPFGKILNTPADSETRTQREQDVLSWLTRRDVPKPTLARIGVSGRLEGEGEAIRAYTHLFRLAREVLQFHAWIMLIDQVEDLWRSSEITPVKRARFLTDLRTLVDECLEGAPIPVILAWNTQVIAPGRVEETQVEDKFQAEYRSLYSRLPHPIDLPMLPIQEHAYEFAQLYVEAADGSARKTTFLAQLRDDFERILDTITSTAEGRVGDRVNQRAWLRALRAWADESVEHDETSHSRKTPMAQVKIARSRARLLKHIL